MPTVTELFLSRVCRRSFLSLWSHPYPHRYKRPVPHELCDVLAVFGNDVILFSDKSIAFPGHDDLRVAWERWYRRAVKDSSKQLYGATRWLTEHPDRIFADARCTQRLRAPIPDPANARYHLIAVAWGAHEACQRYYGGHSSGSLMIRSSLVGDAHLQEPFCVGRVNANRPFVHVFDEMGLQCVMNEIDTTPDFVEYLVRRAALLSAEKPIITAAGEEELLAKYLTEIDETGAHNFLTVAEREGMDRIMIGEGFWNNYLEHGQRRAKIQADRVSYIWDVLLEHFIAVLPEDAEPHPDGRQAMMSREEALRVMASENRFHRRIFGRHLSEVLERSRNIGPRVRFARVGYIRQRPETAYVFLVLSPDPERPIQGYMQVRNNMLFIHCQILALEIPEIQQVVGIGMLPIGHEDNSEALCLYRRGDMTGEQIAEIRRFQTDLNIFVNLRERVLVDQENEYPDP